MLTTEKLMLVNPKSVTPEAPIKDAMLLMETESMMQLPVLLHERLVGIITDRDICVAIYTPTVSNKIVADYMTADPVTVSPDTPIFRTAQILSTYKFGALPVVEGDKLAGLITSSMLLAHFANNFDKP